MAAIAVAAAAVHAQRERPSLIVSADKPATTSG
jgi:hypothetical protein